jgi:type IV secretory pathway VirB2 component (pilin)
VATLSASPQAPLSHTTTGRATPAPPLGPHARRLVAAAGLASFALIILAAFVAPPLWSSPSTNASATRLVAYLQANHSRTIASLFIYSIAMGLFLCFTGGLWSWLRAAEPGSQPLSNIFAFGAVALTVLVLAAFATAGVMSYRPQQPAIATALSDMTFALLALSAIPTAVCLGAYATLVLRHRCLPVWTAWLAWLAFDAHILIAASFFGHGSFLSLEGAVVVAVPATFFAWILAASAMLLVHPGRRRAPGGPAPVS